MQESGSKVDLGAMHKITSMLARIEGILALLSSVVSTRRLYNHIVIHNKYGYVSHWLMYKAAGAETDTPHNVIYTF